MPFSGFSGFLDFSEADVPVFFVFWVVFVEILRIPMDFKAFWTGPSLARVHFSLHFNDFLDFIEFPWFGDPPPIFENFCQNGKVGPSPQSNFQSMG